MTALTKSVSQIGQGRGDDTLNEYDRARLVALVGDREGSEGAESWKKFLVP